MKKLLTAFTVVAFVLSGLSGVQGQGSTSSFDQLKLFEQFLGTWQGNWLKDTTLVAEIEKHGKAFIETDYTVVNGKKTWQSIWNYSFSPADGKFRIFVLSADGSYITYLASFVSEKKWIQVIVDNFNPEKTLGRSEVTFDNPSSFSGMAYNAQGKKVFEGKVTKVK